jgi:hypothetical protein
MPRGAGVPPVDGAPLVVLAVSETLTRPAQPVAPERRATAPPTCEFGPVGNSNDINFNEYFARITSSALDYCSVISRWQWQADHHIITIRAKGECSRCSNRL